LWIVVGGAAVLLGSVIAVPGLRDLFRFGVLHTDDVVTIAGASLVALLWVDAVRLARRRLRPSAPAPSASPV
jgi:hypothetical protein